MVGFDLLVVACLLYAVLLFLVAFWADGRARRGRMGWLRSPVIYTLSLSIYCTAWTFYGAVGFAARSGLDFVTIYLGPTLVLTGWWLFLRKLVRVARSQRVTSIADLISARFGKSNGLAVLVTLICVVTATPYIALQLQSVALAFDVFARPGAAIWTGTGPSGPQATALWVAAGLALFAILFGTRNLDADERHHGVVSAIALEAVVKLVALVSVGAFVVWGIAAGPSDILQRISASPVAHWPVTPGSWGGLIFLAGAAVLTLPRMFQVMVVEVGEERHLATAAWAFPLYLFLMSLFVLPIAVVGLAEMPGGSNPDLFVLTLPLAHDQGALAMLVFLGGFSSATSMVIVEAIALATMVSNHVVVPVWLRMRGGAAAPMPYRPGKHRSGGRGTDLRRLVLISRRLSIAGILALGYGYYRLSGGTSALAEIGLISFAGVAQILPAMLGGLVWRGATRTGAALGLIAGFTLWLYTLFLPSVGPGGLLPDSVLAEGPWGIGWLRPQALFGTGGLDSLQHALFWSLAVNAALFCLGSLVSFPRPVERLQGLAFVGAADAGAARRGSGGRRTPEGARAGNLLAEDLLAMAQGILDPRMAQEFFRSHATAQGKEGFLPDVTPDFLQALERRLAGSVGAATAHALIAPLAVGTQVTVQDLMAVASEAQQILEYSARLEQKSDELSRTARALGEANDKLTALSSQKDAFLGQVSHELRTPMTSIRAFSEILMEGGLQPEDSARYAGVIHAEAIRLTRLLDDLLDLSVLEGGRADPAPAPVVLQALIDRAVLMSRGAGRQDAPLSFDRDPPGEQIVLLSDAERLVQVFINILSNARKYCHADRPVLRIRCRSRGAQAEIDFIDNGPGISAADQTLIFEKFVRLPGAGTAPGAGLGLAICREIMARLGGTIAYLPGQGGAAFRVTLPLAAAEESAAVSAGGHCS